MATMCERIFRKKPVPSNIMATNLERCLTTSDVVIILIGLLTGSSIYTLPGQVAALCTGPSIFLAIILAGILALINISCYAEFGSKLPKAGAIYTYSYVVYGEIVAFVIAWCSVLHVLLILVFSCRNWSDAIDVLFHNVIRNVTMASLGDVTGGYNTDFLAAALMAVTFFVTALGPRTSSLINKILTIINMTVIAIVMMATFFAADLNNWNRGNFFAFGFSGIICGTKKLYMIYHSLAAVFAYCDEMEDPRKSLTQSIPIVMIIGTFINFAMSISLTLMAPYDALDLAAPHSRAFMTIGWNPLAYLVSAATVIASANVLSGCYVISRNVYALAMDGLLFSCFAKVNDRTKTPLLATLCVGIVAVILTLLLDIAALLELLVIDILIFVVFIAAAVLIVRYCPVEKCPFPLAGQNTTATSLEEESRLISEQRQILGNIGKLRPFFAENKFLQCCIRLSSPHYFPNVCIATYCILACVLFTLIKIAEFIPITNSCVYLAAICITSVTALLPMFILALHVDNRSLDHFQVISRIFCKGCTVSFL